MDFRKGKEIMDALILSLLPMIGKFLMANKMTIFFVLYVLEKGALMTKSTIDNKVLTFIKHLGMRCIGRGYIVDKKYDFMKKHGVLKTVSSETFKHFEEEFMKDFKQQQNSLPDVNFDNMPEMPDVKPIKENSDTDKLANDQKKTVSKK